MDSGLRGAGAPSGVNPFALPDRAYGWRMARVWQAYGRRMYRKSGGDTVHYGTEDDLIESFERRRLARVSIGMGEAGSLPHAFLLGLVTSQQSS